MFPLFVFLTTASLGQAQAALTFKDSYEAALKHSETLASQEKLIDIAEARHRQATANILPSITGNASYIIQAIPSDPLAASFFPRTQPEVKLSLTQPLFRGLRELAALRQIEHQGESEKHEYAQATLNLCNDVAQAYYSVLAAEENVRNIKDQLTLYDERIGELVQRARAGTSQPTDLMTLRSSRAAVLSQLESSQASVASSRELFAFVTGLARDAELSSPNSTAPEAQPVTKYLSGIIERPDILAAQERLAAAEERIGVAKGGRLPSVSLLGNYYFVRQSDIYRGMNWDVQGSFSVPIFAGGAIEAQVRESVLARERAELELGRLRRQAEQQLRTLHGDYVAGLASISALEQSQQLAEKNYQLLRRDYSRGLTRNLDVLQALISAYEARRSLVRARLEARNSWVRLNTAAGKRPIQ